MIGITDVVDIGNESDSHGVMKESIHLNIQVLGSRWG